MESDHLKDLENTRVYEMVANLAKQNKAWEMKFAAIGIEIEGMGALAKSDTERNLEIIERKDQEIEDLKRQLEKHKSESYKNASFEPAETQVSSCLSSRINFV